MWCELKWPRHVFQVVCLLLTTSVELSVVNLFAMTVAHFCDRDESIVVCYVTELTTCADVGFTLLCNFSFVSAVSVLGFSLEMNYVYGCWKLMVNSMDCNQNDQRY